MKLLELLADGVLLALGYLGIAVGAAAATKGEEETAIVSKVAEMAATRHGVHPNRLELSLDLRRPLLPSSREVLDGISREAVSSISVSLG